MKIQQIITITIMLQLWQLKWAQILKSILFIPFAKSF